jgi:hypothetical protein
VVVFFRLISHLASILFSHPLISHLAAILFSRSLPFRAATQEPYPKEGRRIKSHGCPHNIDEEKPSPMAGWVLYVGKQFGSHRRRGGICI